MSAELLEFRTEVLYNSYMRKGSKMTIKQRKRVSEGHLGQPGWNKGKKMSKEFCEKIRIANLEGRCGMKGRKHSAETKLKQSKSNKTKLLWKNPEYRKMMSEKHKWQSGKNNPAYIDGRKPLVMRIRHHPKMKNWIKQVFERDNYICQDCKQRGKKLEAHHLYPFSKIITEYKIKTIKQALQCEIMWDLNNGQTLCKNCHKKINTRR